MPDTNPPQPDAEIIPLTPFDERLQKLEASLAALQSRALGPVAVNEEQLAERVLSVLTVKAAEHRAATGQPAPAGLMPVTQPTSPLAVPAAWVSPTEQSLWMYFVVGIWAEAKDIARMYFDPRYRLSRVTQLGVPGIAVLFALNYLFFNYSCFIPIVNLVVERLGYVILSLVLYKVVVRELGRYREVLAYLARYGQPTA